MLNFRIMSRTPGPDTSDRKRLAKIKELLRRKIATHTNPVEVGVADLAWLIEKAEEAINVQGTVL